MSEVYTKENVTELVAAYQAVEGYEAQQAVIADYAERFEVSKNSIRSKLVRLGVYEKKAYTTKKGEKPVRKDALVEKIAEAMGTFADNLPGLEKANKNTLTRIFEAVSKS
jgi:Zn-dependent peptidase ImmA (M78 family)